MPKVRQPMNLRSFQIFDAVARHRSLTRAAEELGVTQAAVSHQMRWLADRLGERLIEREGRSIALTAAGSQLARTLAAAFDIIAEQMDAFEDRRAIVRLGVYSSFAMPWLIARLPRFVSVHPDIDLRLVMLYDPHEVSIKDADIFITSEPERSGYWTRRLACERLVPVVRADGRANFDEPFRLISAEVEPGVAGRAWEAFAALNELDLPAMKLDGWLCCSHYVFAIEMVRAGLGAALLPNFMVAPDIRAGVLKRLPGSALPTGLNYELHLPFDRRTDPPIATVTAWLTQAVEADPVMSGANDAMRFS